MAFYLLPIICAAALFSCGGESGSFSALSYNVAGIPGNLGGSTPAEFTPQISPKLNAYDLVLVQEDFSYHDELVEDLEHAHLSKVWRDDHEGRYTFVGDGLNRFSTMPFVDHKRQEWLECFGSADLDDGGSGDCLADKGLSVATHILAEDIEIDIYNFHAEAGSTARDVEVQIASYKQFAEFIKNHSGSRAIIVGGDSNLKRADPSDAAIYETFLNDTGLSDVCTFLDCGEDHIDRFFFRSDDSLDIKPQSWKFDSEDFLSPDGESLSDHDPLNVDFVWSEK